MKSNSVLMVIPHMIGGGAERVAAQIINKMNSRGFNTKFILTSSKKHEVVRSDLNEKTPLVLLTEELCEETVLQKIRYLPKRLVSSFFGKLYEKAGKFVPAIIGRFTIEWQYHREIKYIRKLMIDNPDMSVIAFLQPAIPIVLLAAKGLRNTIVVSERGDPNRLMQKRYGRRFIEKYYKRANTIVFQTEDAKAVYPRCIGEKGVIISNPIKENLPLPYHGERNKFITTFCRISKPKNLPLLVEAFAKVHAEHPDYMLRIIGDTLNREGEEVLAMIKKQIDELELNDCVKFESFMSDVHEAILKDAMYVSSSDHEGMSNAMLEAMAIGMPVVCTDCPIGGARATINDGKNGLLVPIRDSDALYRSIKSVIEDNELSNKLSHNASTIRNELSLDTIAEQWINLLRY